MNKAGDYNRIAAAIAYISDNVKKQPSLEEIAAHVNVSPFHFQRMFTEWAGVSPKRFLQFLTIGYAKQILSSKKDPSLFDTADETGLSGTSRLHDLFVNIEGMTPGEFRNSGKGLHISYSFGESQFGKYIVASTPRGICNLHFFDGEEEQAIAELVTEWKNASFKNEVSPYHLYIAAFFRNEILNNGRINLHLKGTGFQLKVWHALLKIPQGGVSNYGNIATMIGQPSASRAVGSAIGSNQVAYLIPCHRVIRNSAVVGDFRWGSNRKKAMLGWEAARLSLPEIV